MWPQARWATSLSLTGRWVNLSQPWRLMYMTLGHVPTGAVLGDPAVRDHVGSQVRRSGSWVRGCHPMGLPLGREGEGNGGGAGPEPGGRDGVSEPLFLGSRLFSCVLFCLVAGTVSSHVLAFSVGSHCSCSALGLGLGSGARVLRAVSFRTALGALGPGRGWGGGARSALGAGEGFNRPPFFSFLFFNGSFIFWS